MDQRLSNRAALVVLLCLAGLPGCYKRVVSTRGVGSNSTKVEEPYRSDTMADRWIDDAFSSQPKPVKKSWVER